jgi:uncharacterized heparinase superfamily protein
MRTIAAGWQQPVLKANPWVGPGRLRFLNQDREILDWNDPRAPKLWLYNLHYFEHPSARFIERWIAENPLGVGNGWEPYPLSLRITNWIKWSLGGGELGVATGSLAAQAGYLADSIEYHLLGNHLFANAKALVFAGCFFDADVWLRKGLAILERELDEQILADGGHFERSPMYHCLILEDVLDLINLGRAYPGLLPDLSGVARRMLGWLQHMTHPDGGIPFFNDAAFGVAPEPSQLAKYAARLGIRPESCPLGETGYIRLESNRGVVLFDTALIGPDYQPGHAHADTLAFELSVNGRRAIVNSGISTYENNAERHAQRSTPAHNTIRVDAEDSSEVWSAFRVARRARPLDVKTDHRMFAEAAHDGYTRLKDPVIHHRRLDLDESELRITDTLQAKRHHNAEVYFHLHPESQVEIHLDPKLVRAEIATLWYPEFNTSIPNRTIIGRWTGTCPVQFTTRIPLSKPER